MKYTILIQRPVEKFITKLARPEKERVLRAIAKLPEVGAFRILYTVDNGKLVVCVIDAGNRGDVYKRY